MYVGPPEAQLVAAKGRTSLGSSAAQQNLARYLARIAAGESSGGRNIGPNPQTGARGEYQFIRTTRDSILSRHGIDAWSPNKQIRDRAALKLIEVYGREKGVNILGAIQQGNFRLADRVLGRSQFTSLPGGAEQHVIWRNPINRIRYGPVGNSGAPLPVFAQQNCTQAPDGGGTFTPGSGKANGRFIIPAKGPATSEMGYRIHPIRGGRKFHAGLDIGARMGAPVKASNGGRVTYAGWMGGYGNIVIVDHGNGMTTRYAHLQGFNVRQGHSVSQGQQIGRVGNTGGSTGPHLHFEIRKHGQPVNPRYYVKF
jgi:murein DD-endopeptidase MepM/ murein hydrolase activator NlpD